MLIEAVRDPIRCRWQGGEVRLEPGQPVDLPEERAQRLLDKAGGKVRRVPVNQVLALRPGSLITWQGADLTLRHGIVDFFHTDPDGQAWAFSALPGGSWTAVNCKFVRAVQA